jgi:GTP-binding protein Era
MSTDFRTGFIAIVGRPNVGKSTLLNALVGQKVSITSKKPQTTRHRITGIHTEAAAQFIFVDTPGFQMEHKNALNRAMNKSVTDTLSSVDVVLFVIESTRFDERDARVMKLLPDSRPVILVINKIDLLESKAELLPFIERMAKEFPFAEIVPIAAEPGQIEALPKAIQPYLPAGPAMYDADDFTDRNERFLAAEIIREKIFRLLGEEVPYAASVMIEQFTQEGNLRRIHASVIVDKPGQKAILIGKGGEKMKAISTQARKDMETLFGSKVYLEVWVKIKSGWADDERALKSLGYGDA